MATTTEDTVNLANEEEQSKDTSEEAGKTVADEQKDNTTGDTTPAATEAATSDPVADDVVKSKREISASTRSPSPAPELGMIMVYTARYGQSVWYGLPPN